MTYIISLLILIAQISNPASTPAEEEKGDQPYRFYKVAYQQKTGLLRYHFKKGKDNRTLEFKTVKGKTQIVMSSGKKPLWTIKGLKDKSTIMVGGKETLLRKYWADLDAFSKEIISNHQLFLGNTSVFRLYDNDKNVRQSEESYAEDLSGCYPNVVGSMSTTCSCGGQTITVHCPAGCGADCEMQNKTRCKINDQGEETDCKTKAYCIPICVC